VLFDRKIEFSDSKKEEWELLRSKIGTGIELPLPDSERWFHAHVDGDDIIVESAKLNVRPLMIHDPIRIDFHEFGIVARHYNSFLELQVRTMSDTHEVRDKVKNLRYVFMLIYHLI
jgi:hypothetical protein